MLKMLKGITFISVLLASSLLYSQDKKLDVLRQDQKIADVTVKHLYSAKDSSIIGAKFEHTSGAPIYVLQIQTVPQVFMWVDTTSRSNNGLAHALEHLLAGKGTTGRYVNLLRDMRLSISKAATIDDYNMYSFSSGSGVAAFYEQFHAWLNALYLSDFTDVEAQREFYHFGVSRDPGTSTPSLIEEGSVYDEMQTGVGTSDYYFGLNQRVFGPNNPFAFYNSGVPSEMRKVHAGDIRHFYQEHYRLGPTTGFVFVLDPNEDAIEFIKHISSELSRINHSSTQHDLEPDTPKYPTSPARDKIISLFPFPSESDSDRGDIRFGWSLPTTDSAVDIKFLQLLFRVLADGEKSLLYRSSVDSRTRNFDSGANQVEGSIFLQNSPHYPAAFVGFSGLPIKYLNVKHVDELRSQVVETMKKVASMKPGSKELAEFNRAAKSEALAWRRSQSVWIKNSPRFGENYQTDWKEYFEYLDINPAFVQSIGDESVWDGVDKRLGSPKNIWAEVIQRFRLLDMPYGTASVPSLSLFKREEVSRQERISDEL
ncbi:MAG TPA: hypothetical protein VGF44_06950, partial [Terriglobales bacterium]